LQLKVKQTGPNPTLIRIDVNVGHGVGKSTEAIINERVDIQAVYFI
jgi:prolyl oligopeptidase